VDPFEGLIFMSVFTTKIESLEKKSTILARSTIFTLDYATIEVRDEVKCPIPFCSSFVFGLILEGGFVVILLIALNYASTY